MIHLHHAGKEIISHAPHLHVKLPQREGVALAALAQATIACQSVPFTGALRRAVHTCWPNLSQSAEEKPR